MQSTAYSAGPHLLNHVPQPGGAPPVQRSRWCNLGLWRDGCVEFAPACAALARALADAVELGPSDSVLDVGVGYAEQALLWAEEFRVRDVLGVEPSAAHVVAARSLVDGRGLGGAVRVVRGEANHLPLEARRAFDVVLSLDSAYHFESRRDFIASAAELLKPGGRFGAVDILPCAHGSYGWRWAAQRLVAVACGIPAPNLHGAAAYVDALRDAGLGDVEVRRIEGDVFAPFAAYATRQRRRLAPFLSLASRCFLLCVGALFSFIGRHRLFCVVLITARRTRPEEEALRI